MYVGVPTTIPVAVTQAGRLPPKGFPKSGKFGAKF
jgi:hypothetical protein